MDEAQQNMANLKDHEKAPASQEPSGSDQTSKHHGEVTPEIEHTRLMFYTARHQGLLDEIEDQDLYNEVLAAEIPKKYHKAPEVIETKTAEKENFIRLNAIEEVEDQGQPRISSRWVITEKQNHDGMEVKMKARLAVRGFQEAENPRSNSPTLLHDSLRIWMTITGNEDFEIRSLDVKNAHKEDNTI